MNPSQIDAEFYGYLLTWLVGPVLLFVILSRGGRLAGMLIFTYILGFFINHWLGALVYATSTDFFEDTRDTVAGFRLSTYALLALMLGALLIPSGRGGYLRNTRFGVSALSPRAVKALKHVALPYVAIGVVIWSAGFTPLASLPSASAVITAGRQCLLLGICLLVWDAWQMGSVLKYRAWATVAFCLPIVTVVTQGFIGYGISMLGTIVVFIAMFYRPRWHLVLGLFCGIYVAMSVWVAYASHRDAIREMVWGDQSYGARAAAVFDALASTTPFDSNNEYHVRVIDLRLNQNQLVGQAMRTTPDFVPYEYGKTVLDALVSLIPRAIWPEKPSVGGSGNYVAVHTMQQFAEDTSVGMGQVLEFYINFGVESVLAGFLLFGMLLRYLDLRMTSAMVQGNVPTMQLSFLVGAGALQSGGSLSEIVASMGGGATISLLITRYLSRGRALNSPTMRHYKIRI